MKKRVLSLLLCFVLAAGLLSVCAPPAQAGTIAGAFEQFIKQPGQIKKLFGNEVAHGDCGPAGDEASVHYKIYEVTNPTVVQDNPFLQQIWQIHDYREDAQYYGVYIFGDGPMADYAVKGQKAPWMGNVEVTEYNDKGQKLGTTVVENLGEDYLVLAYIAGATDEEWNGRTEHYTGVTNVGNCAFKDCQYLTCMFLNDDITTISERAFYKDEYLSAINMPRKLLKLFLYEEMPRIIASVPGASSFVKRSYAQLRKSNCRSWTITQEAGQLMVQDKEGSDLATIIMGQSKQYYLLKNKDKGNMEFFRRFIALSDDAVNAVMNFPAPEHIPGRKYSSYLYYIDNGEYPLVGVVRHYANPLTIAVASTSGEAFSKREEELRRLRILYPKLDEGQLLIEYENRQRINNPALKLLREMLNSRDFSRLDVLHEELTRLSLQNAGFRPPEISERIRQELETINSNKE